MDVISGFSFAAMNARAKCVMYSHIMIIYNSSSPNNFPKHTTGRYMQETFASPASGTGVDRGCCAGHSTTPPRAHPLSATRHSRSH